MRRKTGKRGIALVTSFEGLRLKAYPDPRTGGDPWTIGYGHTHGVHPGQKITRRKARALLRGDLKWAEDAINALRLPLNQNQFDALVSFVYNLGAGILKAEHDIGRLLRQRKWKAAADSMLEYRNPGTPVEAGLLRRRRAERHLFLSHVVRAKAHQLVNRIGRKR